MRVRKIISILLVLSFVMAVFAIPASAATSGSNKSAKIYVSTKSNWLKSGTESITLTPRAGVMKNNGKFTDCSWNVCVYRYGAGTKQYYTLKGNSSLKIKLARNANYQITVSPTASYSAICEIIKAGTGIKSYPSWYVSSTCKVSSIS